MGCSAKSRLSFVAAGEDGGEGRRIDCVEEAAEVEE